MTLKSKQVITGSRLVRSRSSDNLPTSQSQVNIQMMSHTLTIREVSNYRDLYFYDAINHIQLYMEYCKFSSLNLVFVMYSSGEASIETYPHRLGQ